MNTNETTTPETDAHMKTLTYKWEHFDHETERKMGDIERRLFAMTKTAKQEEDAKEYNARLCEELKQSLAIARDALERLDAELKRQNFTVGGTLRMMVNDTLTQTAPKL